MELENTKKEFFCFLDARRDAVLKDASLFALNNRKDESNVLKARSNIYDIFKALWNASEKEAKDIDSFKAALNTKVINIPAQWEKSLEEARKYDDTRLIMVEEAKLEAVKEIREKINELLY